MEATTTIRETLSAEFDSPAQAAIVAAHLEAGRVLHAAIVAAMPAEDFAEADRRMEAAFALGLANGLNRHR